MKGLWSMEKEMIMKVTVLQTKTRINFVFAQMTEPRCLTEVWQQFTLSILLLINFRKVSDLPLIIPLTTKFASSFYIMLSLEYQWCDVRH